MLQIKKLNLTHKKDLRIILNDFNLVLNDGDKAVIIGEEGNGKSTLMKWIYNPSLVENYIEADGERIMGHERLGYLPQEMLDEDKEKTIYEYFSEEEIQEYCIVIGGKEEKEYKNLYKVKIVNSKNKKRNGTRLYLRVDKKTDIELGDMLFVKGSYIEPDVDRNERGFNYKEYLKSIGIYGTVEVDKYDVIGKEKIDKFLMYTNGLKQRLKSNIEQVIKKEENKNLLIAMILGDTCLLYTSDAADE